MTDKITIERETLERAIDAMQDYARHTGWTDATIGHLRAALAAQPTEPVAWRVRRHDSPKYWIIFMHKPVDALTDPEREVQPLYAAQPAPAAVPLTDEQIRDAVKEAGLDWHRGYIVDDVSNRYEDLCRIIERAHGIAAGDKT